MKKSLKFVIMAHDLFYLTPPLPGPLACLDPFPVWTPPLHVPLPYLDHFPICTSPLLSPCLDPLLV